MLIIAPPSPAISHVSDVEINLPRSIVPHGYAYGLDTGDETDCDLSATRVHEDFCRFNRVKLYADRSESQRGAIRNVLKQASHRVREHDDRIYRRESERDTECGIEFCGGKSRANSRCRAFARARHGFIAHVFTRRIIQRTRNTIYLKRKNRLAATTRVRR